MAVKTFEPGTKMSTTAKLRVLGQGDLYDVVIRKEQYGQSGALALVAEDATTGEPFATLSVNILSTPDAPCSLPSKKLPLDHCFFKVWSENEGLLEQLIEQKIVKRNGPRHQYTGAELVQVLF